LSQLNTPEEEIAMTAFVELDVRPVLRAGGEPFEKIMETINTLQPGQGLKLFATFKPTPLLHVLGAKGYTHEAHELDGGEWEVLFSPPATPPATAPDAAPTAPASDQSEWPEPVKHLDNRDLDPPEPLVRTLAATETMATGEVLCALLCREPVFLLPELEKRGHRWRGGFEPDGKTYKILIRIGAASGAAA
jgi:TusA-related sulfurtransferase